MPAYMLNSINASIYASIYVSIYASIYADIYASIYASIYATYYVGILGTISGITYALYMGPFVEVSYSQTKFKVCYEQRWTI